MKFYAPLDNVKLHPLRAIHRLASRKSRNINVDMSLKTNEQEDNNPFNVLSPVHALSPQKDQTLTNRSLNAQNPPLE